MHAWMLDDFGLENLNLHEISTPEPAAGRLLIKVSAVSLNYRDKALVDSIYAPEKMPKGLVPVADFGGVVASIGPSLTKTFRSAARSRRPRGVSGAQGKCRGGDPRLSQR